MKSKLEEITMQEIISDLKKNPVYSMSLGGKELFHSNMLAWLLMSEENQNIKQLFGVKEDKVVLNVFREHQNLDLLILNLKQTDTFKQNL